MKKAVKPKTTAKPKVAAKPKPAAKPKATAKPKSAAKPVAKSKSTAKPKPATKLKAAAKPKAATKAVAKPKTKASAKVSSSKAAAIAARMKADAAKDIADKKRVKAMLKTVLKNLEDNKAEDIVAIDLSNKTPMADYMIVASGRSGRHVGAVSDHLIRALRDEGFGHARVEGMTQGDWVLIDIGDIVIHVFRPEVREFYRLEKMWAADIPEDQAIL